MILAVGGLVLGDISSFVESLSINPWIILFTAGCTMVAVPLAFYFYLKSKKDKLPRYASRSNNIIKGTTNIIPAVTIRFAGHGEAIENLTVSKLIFWNAGRDTIRKQDIVSPQGIIIRAKDGCTILNAEIIQRTTAENEFEITTSQDKSHVRVTFKYIDRNEGAVIQVFHTGLKDDDVEVVGKIMGAGSPVKMYVPHSNLTPQKTPQKFSMRENTYRLTMAISAPIVFSIGIWLASLALPLKEQDGKPMPLFVHPLFAVAFFICIFGVSWYAAYFVWQMRIPAELDLFYEDE